MPKRIFETPTQFGLLDKAYMEETLQEAKEEIMKLVQGIWFMFYFVFLYTVFEGIHDK